jgi:ribA/ribD-fused uncharacterized protein
MIAPDEARSIAELVASYDPDRPPPFLFFWGHTPPTSGAIGPHVLSQWYPAPFEVDGTPYPTAEHFMMAAKARLFGDQATLAAILGTGDPHQAKKLGRQVQGFISEIWERECFELVIQGNLAKFSQNPDLGQYLQQTGAQVLVEASPHDRIWGIGLGAEEAQNRSPATWPGLNRLGFALMETRSRLRDSTHG